MDAIPTIKTSEDQNAQPLESHDQESESPSSPHILKISEMGLFVDGEYLGEIGNPSYRDRPDMFEYGEEGPVLITGNNESALLDKTDLLRLPGYSGYVSFERLLGSESAVLSGREFERKLYQMNEDIADKVKKVTFIAKQFGVKWTDDSMGWCINKIGEVNKTFSPEQLIESVIQQIESGPRSPSDSDAQKNLSESLKSLERTGSLEPSMTASRDSIVNYFYLYCSIKGIDVSNPDAIYDKAFDDFIFLDQLVAEFKRNPDLRFSDALLVACSRQAQEWQKELDAEENSSGD